MRGESLGTEDGFAVKVAGVSTANAARPTGVGDGSDASSLHVEPPKTAHYPVNTPNKGSSEWNPMWIRRATSNDVGEIQTVARDSWESDYPFLSRESLQQGIHEWYTDDRIRRALSDPSTLILVAEEDGRVVGFAHAWANFRQRAGNILRMYVHPQYRGRGIGRALYDESAATLAAEGIVRLQAETLAENPLGNEFYRSLGFVKTGERWTNVGGNWLLENTYAREGIGRELAQGRRIVSQ